LSRTYFEREITPEWLRDFHQTESNGFLEKGFRNSRNYILKFLFPHSRDIQSKIKIIRNATLLKFSYCPSIRLSCV